MVYRDAPGNLCPKCKEMYVEAPIGTMCSNCEGD